MKKNFKIESSTVILFLVVGFTIEQSYDEKNIAFDLADISADFRTDFGTVFLEAFKSLSNDLIIQNKETEKYSQLRWISLGHPKLVRTSNQIFAFKEEGFNIYVELLTDTHRLFFKELIKEKYNIDIRVNQLVSLIPDRFDCQLTFYKDDQKILINGKAFDLKESPVKVTFDAYKKSKERILFEERLKLDENQLDIDILCEVNSKGKSLRTNTLVISGSQLNQIGLMDKIFGVGSEAYVTRNQISEISSKLYLTLNVIEEYQFSETRFKENFINDFIIQTATSIINDYIPIDEAIAKLSKYEFTQDIKPSVIKDEFSRLYYVNKTDSKEILTLNTTQYNRFKSASSIDASGSANAWYKVFYFSGSASYSESRERDWITKNTLFVDQLSELNSYEQNEVEFARSGDIIIPKSLKVSQLSRANFNKNLLFSRIKREVFDSFYTKQFALETKNVLNISLTAQDNIQRILHLEKQLQLNQDSLNSISNSTTTQLSLLNRNLINLNSNLKKNISILNSRILNITSSLNKKAIVCSNPLFFGFKNRKNTTKHYLVADQLMSWMDGLNFCKDKEASLPMTKEASDLFAVRDFFPNNYAFILDASGIKPIDGYWIGLNLPINSFGNFKWIDGSNLTNSFRNQFFNYSPILSSILQSNNYVADAYFVEKPKKFFLTPLTHLDLARVICELQC